MSRLAVFVVVLIAFVGVGPVAAGGVELQQTTVLGEVRQTYVGPGSARFGSSLAALGEDRILIGASDQRIGGAAMAGAAHLFDVDSGALLRTFENPTPNIGDRFGVSVAALDSNRFVIGARSDDDQGSSSGIAYLYDADTGGVLTIFHHPTSESQTEFGQAVATLGDDRVLVGAYRENNDRGAAFLFDADSGDLLQSFFSPAPGSIHFGFCVAGMGADRVLISSTFDDARV